jgi:hypothetical protein
MEKIFSLIKLLLPVFILILFNGCLTFHKVSYVVKLTNPTEGTVNLTAYDIRSTAKDSKEFEQDKNNLFQYMLKSDQFLKDQRTQGKDIISRKLYVENGELIGQGEYKFSEIKNVEGMKYEGGFHYLNLSLDDSVISTNGELIKSKDFKRIMWDSTFTELKFTMLGNSFQQDGPFRSLAPYYNQKKKK